MTVRDPSDGSVSSFFENPDDPLTEESDDDFVRRAINESRWLLALAQAKKRRIEDSDDGPEAA